LGLVPALLRALDEQRYDEPTPIQRQAIPEILQGRDLLGCAQTGTGKTAAFVLPMLQLLSRTKPNGRIRALVLAPTRELAAQIAERAGAYGKHVGLKQALVYGGVGQRPQEQALAGRPDLVVATPGRLLDLMKQGFVRLDAVEFLVLDEADRMLDMGFIHDVRRVIAAVPKQRQTLLFSATMPKPIQSLADSILSSPAHVSVTPQATTAETVDESVYHVSRQDKLALLEQMLREGAVERAIVFTRTKHGANRLSQQLTRAGLSAAAIHGNKSQSARERALEGLRNGTVTALVATDIAARGIDVRGISHVVNYDLPNDPESYVHRIGRTGRAGERGVAISLCDDEEKPLLRDIERIIRRRINVAVAKLKPRAESSAPRLDVMRDPREPRLGDRGPERVASGGGQRPDFRSGGQPNQQRQGSGGGPAGRSRGPRRRPRGPQA
jgi:ATP-dependent RNA helicase RhlE